MHYAFYYTIKVGLEGGLNLWFFELLKMIPKYLEHYAINCLMV